MIVLFDIDGTLTTGSGCGRASLERALNEHLGATGSLLDAVDLLRRRGVAMGLPPIGGSPPVRSPP